ncbi:hypothetical protein BN8_02115 [Fibrisoma limi BUZ 3]|uniref:HTH cro/C1-type domain-containing protein n=1 Tax=Fibrisoma limi BUZ 3 TaxID=1185876 RepID=I2GGM7_9BACT|nr:XRE family transcriptional regulator [Fibrisoma limi]CCH53052.1 hypothetical protein BN8_02115 [Fibrisoma limi BUZ 3]
MISATERVRVIFGLKLKQLRQDKGFQLYELADKAGLSPSYLNEIEKGKKYPKSEKIFALADALGTDYDTLVSVKLSKQLEPIAELLNSNILSELPLELFGIEPADLLELLSQAPSRVSAFISTIIEISRNHGMNVEQFYFSALRSFQELHNNYFEDIESVAADFLSQHTGNNQPTEPPFGESSLRQILEAGYNYRIDEFTELDFPALTGIRSLVLPGSPTVLMINQALEPQQRAFTYGREIGFRVMQLANRPLVSSQHEAESFEQVLNNYKASYFAGAILIPRHMLITGLASFFVQPTWEPQMLLNLMYRFDATPEVFMHRISNVMTSHFGIDQFFFLRFDNALADNRFTLAKELHLVKHQATHGTIYEHYCHRLVSLTLLQELARQQQTGVWNGQPLCSGQIAAYMDTGNQYLMLTIAKPSPPRVGYNSSVTLGFAINERLRAQMRFLDDPNLQHRAVNETCERCGALDCLERAHAPVLWKKQRRNEQIKQELASLRAGLPAT